MTALPTKAEIAQLRARFPDRICVFVELGGKSAYTDLPPLDKRKFLVPRDMTVASFLFLVRRRMTLPPDKALFLFVSNTLPVGSTLIADLYAAHGKAGYLTVVCAGESTFGCGCGCGCDSVG